MAKSEKWYDILDIEVNRMCSEGEGRATEQEIHGFWNGKGKETDPSIQAPLE